MYPSSAATTDRSNAMSKLPKKDIIMFPNNKPHVTKEVKDCINRGGIRLNIILKVSNFVLWRDTNNLTGNVGKTEEIIFDPKGLGDYGLVIIRDTIISQVGT